nr:F0F1 ATP synthase subunit delta [uncultured Desulfobulbus sp.]
MNIDPFTFVLEIINFLVLLWLLHRFLYKPIKQAIADRREALNRELAAAQQQQREALALKAQYEQNMAEWEQEKTRQEEALHLELAREQEAALVKVRQTAEAERVRLLTLTEQELANQRRQVQSLAAQTALHLTSKMLARMAGSELDQVILRILLEDLAQLPEAERSLLQAAACHNHAAVNVTTARTLDQEQQQQLKDGLLRVLDKETLCAFNQDADLLSGFRLSIGDQVVQADLGDELAFFARSLSLEAQ